MALATAYKNGVSQLNGKLISPYQEEGVMWLLYREMATTKGGFLCDEMGLGKTIQMITTMLSNPKPKTLVVVPNSVMNQWFEEFKKFAPHLTVIIHEGPERAQNVAELSDFDVMITPYSLMRTNETPIPLYIRWDRVILDEAHEIRNHKSKTHKNCMRLVSKIKWVVSGTPVVNRMDDFVNLGMFVGIPRSFIQGRTSQVRDNFVLRRTKEQVAEYNKSLELPECIIENIELDMYPCEQSMYNDTFDVCKAEALGILQSSMGNGYKAIKLLESFLRLRQAMTCPLDLFTDTEWDNKSAKMDSIIEDIMLYPHEKSIVFCHFIKEMSEYTKRLMERGVEIYVINGSIDFSDRVRQLDKFKNTTKHAVFLIQIKAGGQGINLQEATRVYITTPSWNPATELQAIGRSHRTGQTNKVCVKRYTYKDQQGYPSIEETINDIQGHKSIVCASVLNDPSWLKKIPKKTKSTLNVRTLAKIFST